VPEDCDHRADADLLAHRGCHRRARVSAEAEAAVDRFAGLRRIGIDEISYWRGHNYLVIVVDYDTGKRSAVPPPSPSGQLISR
jgi:transposase